jgi:hypothetical protein
VTDKRLVDTPTLMGKAGSARALSVATIMGDRKRAFHNAEAPASVAVVEEALMVVAAVFMAVAAVTDRSSVSGIGSLMIFKWREAICSERG